MNYFNKQYKEINLLIWGAGIVICSYIIAFIYSFFINNEPTEAVNSIKIIPFFYGIIIAPILEEFVFRGVYTKKKLFFWIYILGVPCYIIMAKAFIGIPVFFISLWIIIQQKKDKNRYIRLVYFINSLLFSVMHLNLLEGVDIIVLLQVGIRMGMGLILIWMVLNFNLFISIAIHSLHNFTIFLLQFIAVSSISNSDIIKTVNIDNYKLEWKTNYNLFNNKSIYINQDTLKLQNHTFIELLEFKKINIYDNDSIKFNSLYKNEKNDIILIKNNNLTDDISEKQMIELLLNANILQKSN